MDWDDLWLPRRVFGVFVLLAGLGLALAALSGVFVFDVRLGEDALNAATAAKLPIQRKTGPVQWRVEAAKLTVLGQGRLAVDAQVKAATAAHEAQARVAGSGVLAYREGAFWLADIDLDALEILSVRSPEGTEKRSLGKILGRLVARSETLKRALESVKDEALTLGVGEAGPVLDAVFKTVPVYRLRDDWKGTAARAVLLSVRTEGRELVATLDPVGEAARIVAGVVIALALLYFALGLIAAFTSWLGAWGEALLFWW